MSDIREDQEAMQVYWAMRGVQPSHCINPSINNYLFGECIKCGAELNLMECKKQRSGLYIKYGCSVEDPITMSIGDLAFWMRDQCDIEDYEACLCGTIAGEAPLVAATPEEMIRAACAAWKGSDK